MFYSPYYSGQDSGVSWLGRVKQRILEDKRTVATGQNTSTNETPYLRSLFSLLVLFAHFWIAKLENSREEGKNCRLLWWPPASSSCLPFFLSLCISMPWKFREAIIPNGGVTDSSTKGKCLKFYLCNCAFENLLRNISHKTKYIVGWNETRKGQSSCEVKSE